MDDAIRKKLEAAKLEQERKEQEEEARKKAARDEKAAQIAKMEARKTELKGKILAEIDEFEKSVPKYLKTPFPYESFCKESEKSNARFSLDEGREIEYSLMLTTSAKVVIIKATTDIKTKKEQRGELQIKPS